MSDIIVSASCEEMIRKPCLVHDTLKGKLRLESALAELNYDFVYGKPLWKERTEIGTTDAGKAENAQGKEGVCKD